MREKRVRFSDSKITYDKKIESKTDGLVSSKAEYGQEEGKEKSSSHLISFSNPDCK